MLMRLLQFHLSATSASESNSQFGHEHGAAMMSLLKEAMLVADAQMKRSASQKVVKNTQRIVVTLSYEHLSGFTHLLHLCLKKWVNQLTRAEEVTVRGKFYIRNKMSMMFEFVVNIGSLLTVFCIEVGCSYAELFSSAMHCIPWSGMFV
jgi:hypothetical protein